jgi:hypothetical protein
VVKASRSPSLASSASGKRAWSSSGAKAGLSKTETNTSSMRLRIAEPPPPWASVTVGTLMVPRGRRGVATCMVFSNAVMLRSSPVSGAGWRRTDSRRRRRLRKMCIVADRGFGDQKLYRVLTEELKFDYVILRAGWVLPAGGDAGRRSGRARTLAKHLCPS